MTKRKLWMYVGLVLAAALFTFGCGGDDNGGLSAEDMARITAAEDAAADAMAEAAAAEARAMAAEAEAMEAEAAEAAAVAAAATAEAARMAAVAEAMEAMAMSSQAAEDQKDAEDARDAAIAAQGVAEAARDAAVAAAAVAEAARMDAADALATANMTIEALQAQLAAGPGTTGTLEGVDGRAAAQRIEEGMMESPLERETLDRAKIDNPNAIGTTPTGDDIVFPADPEPGDDDYHADMEPRMVIPDDVSVTDLKQARLGTPAELTLSVKGGTGLGTAMHSAEMDAPEIAGFTGVALERDGPGPITQMALVYSDAERSVRAFGDVYRYNAGLNAAGDDLLPGPLTEGQRTHLLVGTATPLVNLADLDANVDLNHGLSTTTGVLMRALTGDPATAAGRAARRVSGTYAGVSGQFLCVGATGTACNIQLSGGNVQIELETNTELVFRADNAESLLPDTDYLAFGVWTEVPDSPTLANPGRVRAFVAGNASVFKHGDVDPLTGMASYSGGAVGHYATRAQGSHTAEMGRFTASATLSANFDGGATPLLSGKVDSFMDEDGMEMMGWLVNLDKGAMLAPLRFAVGNDIGPPDLPDNPLDPAAFMATDIMVPRPSTDGDIYGTTSGTTGSQSWDGIWDAWLFGNNTSAHPTGVAGRFIATSGSAQPMTTPEGLINLFEDEGFAGVIGAFAGR